MLHVVNIECEVQPPQQGAGLEISGPATRLVLKTPVALRVHGIKKIVPEGYLTEG